MNYNDDDFDLPGKIETNVTGAYNEYLRLKEIFNKISTRDLERLGWLDSEKNKISIEELYSHRVSQTNTYFRKRSDASDAVVMLWQAKVALEASNILIKQQVKKFTKISREDLKDIAKLSIDSNNIVSMPRILAEHGIILIYQRSLPGMKLDGSVFLHLSGTPVIGISFRYPRVDHFWFTLLHELAHVHLHIDQINVPILENFEDSDHQGSDIEIQANRAAKFSFVDKPSWRNCKAKYSKQEQDIIEYANEMSVHPSIIAGLLQSEQGEYNKYRKITDEINIRKLVFGDD